MPVSCLRLLFAILAVTGVAMGEDKQQIVAEQMRYLEHLQQAETHLQAGNPDRALAELEQALSRRVLDSYVPQLDLQTKGAAAHYLRACVHAAKQDEEAAIQSLREAAANGFRNTALVKSDPRLANLREKQSFQQVLKEYPDEKPTDEFAGKMVADRDFGIALQMHRKGNFPKLGELAPALELDLLGDRQEKFKLADFRGKKPVVLVFGSFT